MKGPSGEAECLVALPARGQLLLNSIATAGEGPRLAVAEVAHRSAVEAGGLSRRRPAGRVEHERALLLAGVGLPTCELRLGLKCERM